MSPPLAMLLLYRWWPAEVCRLSVFSKHRIKDTWLTADAEFAVRLFGSGLVYGSHHGRYFYFQTNVMYMLMICTVYLLLTLHVIFTPAHMLF